MQGIPTVNLIAVTHLILISIFIGMYCAEAVLELASFKQKGDIALHRSIIRLHFWIDVIIEIPIVLGIIGTGLTMAFLVERLTVLHWVKICSVILFILIAVFCPLNVIERYRLMKRNSDENTLQRKSKIIIYTAGISMALFFTTALILGFWLAYNRVLSSIYS